MDRLAAAAAEVLKAFEPSASSALKEATTHATQRLAAAFPAPLAHAITAIAGPTASAALAFLKSMCSDAESLASRVERLLREPLETGTRVALEVLRDPANGESEAERHIDRLRFAVENFERAFTLLHDRLTRSEVLNLLVLHGTCALAIPGGRPEAHERFVRAAALLDEQAHEAGAEARVFVIRAETAEERLKLWASRPRPPATRWLDGVGLPRKPASEAEVWEYEGHARDRRARAAEASQRDVACRELAQRLRRCAEPFEASRPPPALDGP